MVVVVVVVVTTAALACSCAACGGGCWDDGSGVVIDGDVVVPEDPPDGAEMASDGARLPYVESDAELAVLAPSRSREKALRRRDRRWGLASVVAMFEWQERVDMGLIELM